MLKYYDERLDLTLENDFWFELKDNSNVEVDKTDKELISSDKGEVNKKSVVQLSLDGTIVMVYDSLDKAVKVTGFNEEEIRKCALGMIPFCGGYNWKYVDNA